MNQFLQATGLVLIGVVLILSIRGNGKEFGLLISVFVCCALGCLAVSFLRPVVSFVQQLQHVGSLDDDMISVLMKIVGIAFVSEIATMVCNDAGNSAMGKALQFLAVAVILYLSLPMLTALLELVESVLEKV